MNSSNDEENDDIKQMVENLKKYTSDSKKESILKDVQIEVEEENL
jgi:hypothetical protein